MKYIKPLLLSIMFVPLMATAQRKDGHDRGWKPEQPRTVNMGQAGSALTIYSENGDHFYLLLNGIKQNTYAQSRVRIEGLPEVANDIQVIFDDNTTRAISKTINFVDPVDGRPINLTLKITRERDGNACLRFQRAAPLERDYHREQDEYVMFYGRDNQNGQNYPPPAPPVPAGPVAMDDNSFKDAVQTIKNSSFDDTKLSTAKTIAADNYFTVDQVITLCKLMSFDDSKLSLAKSLYEKTIDNSNYYKVANIFSFDSDKKSLNDFISKSTR